MLEEFEAAYFTSYKKESRDAIDRMKTHFMKITLSYYNLLPFETESYVRSVYKIPFPKPEKKQDKTKKKF